MKVVLSQTGRFVFKTMTVIEVRELLAAYPDNMPVFATWEGVDQEIVPSRFYVEKLGPIADCCDCLVIDVNVNY